MKVLVADDDATTRILLDSNLRKWGYEAMLAETGDEAWRLLQQEPAPRIAVLDWMMPGLDGVEICRRLRERGSGGFVYTILLTSRSDQEDLVHALDAGAHNFQRKPVSPEELRCHVNVGRRLVEMEEALARAERSAATGSLAAGIAHQFNNLNCGILGNAELILQDESLGERNRKRLSMIVEAANRAREITSRLMTLTRQSSQKRDGDLRRIVEEMIGGERDRLREMGGTMELRLHPTSPTPLHEGDIAQIVLILLSNARHALLEREEKRVTVETGEEGGRLYLRVADTGWGIPRADLRRIFAPFYSTKGEHARTASPMTSVRGLGLGLNMAEAIARQHGGTLEVESREGEGSAFTLWLPVETETAADAATPTAE